MVSLLYWTLLFTLGALMLDSFLCQVAGKRVMGTVDKISQSDGTQEKDRTKKGGAIAESTVASLRADERNDAVNVTNTVGRFVRWYIEGPDERADGKTNIANHKLGGEKARTKPALGPNSDELNTSRTRKPSAVRGSFKHIE
ncbi:hypothetical protein GGI15_001362 [Coemansia interrupta]|uniref:Uncharacterized protein n=1 Tax=Coemansia interrupta TaxID=1126814 RepID=A0A9W8LNZ2_9FUNG|nr:hypothetical protein GGI15_001362 [Coemansia interrupta]